MQLNETQVLVMGLGVHGGGLGVSRWLIRQGARVTVTDTASPEALATPLAQLEAAAAEAGTTVSYTLGGHRAEDFTRSSIIIANPAVRPDSPWLALARTAGAAIESEMSLFFRRCLGPILAITGTKGKTTTATLLASMLRQARPDTVLAGNLRVSALEALDQIGPATPVVLELSSFQLMGLGAAGLSPAYSAITNLSPDHLNYHGSMEAYAQAKQQIFAHQGADGLLVLPAAEAEAGLLWPLAGYAGRMLTFSLEPADQADCTIDAAGWATLGGERLFQAAELGRGGRHNLANALVAAALARSFGATPTAIGAAVRGFSGVEHRQELVAEIGGVRFVNDTTATNPAAAITALESIAPPIVLIAGGSDKGLPLGDLADAIVRRARAVVLLEGSATAKLAQAIVACSLQLAGSSEQLAILGPYSDFTVAIRAAYGLAKPGDTVLLSPGCASFGMFANEFQRGEEFRRIVKGLVGNRE